MTQTLYAHMNKIKIKKNPLESISMRLKKLEDRTPGIEEKVDVLEHSDVDKEKLRKK
jgi:hypothetical protein